MTMTDKRFEEHAAYLTMDMQNDKVGHCVAAQQIFTYAQIPLGSSRHVSTRHDMFGDVSSASSRAVRQALHSQIAWSRHVERVVSCRDVTSQVEFGF